MIKLTAARRPLALQFFKFSLVGACGFVLDFGLVYLGIYVLGMTRTIAGLFSFMPVVTFTWLGNRIFTFHDAPKLALHKQWVRFAMVCCIGLVFNRGTYSLLVSRFPLVYDHPILGLFAGTGAGVFFNFFASKKLVFVKGNHS